MCKFSEFSEAVYYPPEARTFLAYQTFSDNWPKTIFSVEEMFIKLSYQLKIYNCSTGKQRS